MNCKIYYLRILKITCYEKVSFSRYFKFLFTGLFLFFSVKPVATVPFEMVGSYVVVQVRINNSTKLSLVLDTG